MMRKIGVTGGVGSGKSEVLHYLEENYPAYVLRSDELARDMMKKGGVCYRNVRNLFGDDVLLPDGELDRKAIAAAVFQNEALLQRLNEATHPPVMEEIARIAAEQEESGTRYFFLESALLLEEKYNEKCDELWYVYAQESVRRERLKRSRGYSDRRIDEIMMNQKSEEDFRKVCDFTLDNSGSFEETRRQIDMRMREESAH